MNRFLVSVTILNYQRREALAQTLTSVEMQSYQPREIIVVDNGSKNRTDDFLHQHFPRVHLVALPKNIGAAARNRGVIQAHGHVVVMLDNDVAFDSAYELQKIVNAFERLPEAGCIVFKVLDASGRQLHVRDWCHPRSYLCYQDTEFETPFITEGACAFRRDTFLQLGGYYEPLFIGHEGWDLALRLLNQGGRIVYTPAVRVRHAELKDASRENSRPYYYYTRNYIWIAARNYPLALAVPFLVKYIAMMAFFSIRVGQIRAFARGLRDGLTGLPMAWRARKPFSNATAKTLRRLTRERPGLFASWYRHRQRPQI